MERFRLAIPIMVLLVAACSQEDADHSAPAAPASEVVIYTALDQIFSEPLLQKFERETGIRVRVVYDAESAKTVGLVNRLLAEKASPRCDVFWNNEILRTLLLKREGVTQAYESPSARDIPATFRDRDHHWAGFGARARVILYNKDLVSSGTAPTRLQDLTDARWRGRCAIANPLFGTTATQAAVLWWLWGPERTQTFFLGVKKNDVVQMPGNAMVRDQVASGEMAWGLTDTDDAHGALLDRRPVGITVPLVTDAQDKNPGLLLIPNTVSLIARGPHPDAGRNLIDYLLSREVETALAQGRSAQLPLHPGIAPPAGWETLTRLPWLPVDWNAVLDALEPSTRWLDENFVR